MSNSLNGSLHAPRFSIAICTCNRAAHLAPTLDSIARVLVPAGARAELILADNNSSDDTKKIFDARANLLEAARIEPIYVFEGRVGQARARNAALKQARGEIISFTDDDVRVPRDWLEHMSTPILAGKADAVGGGVRLAPHLARAWMTPLQRGWLASTEDDLQKYPDCEIDPGRMVGANMTFSRRVLEKIPGFDEELGPGALGFCDDILFSLQLKAAQFKLRGLWRVEAEHHFDPSRLSRASLLERARKEGRSTAYLWYHWMHLPVRAPRLKALFHKAQLDLWRSKKPREYSNPNHEGCAEREMILESKLACFGQYSIEMRRPRNYQKHGLKKINS